MDIQKNYSLEFGASEAGLIFLAVLLSYLFDDVAIATVLKSPWIQTLLAIGERSDLEVMALKRALSGVVGPCLMFGVTIVLLKLSLPKLKISEIFEYFGLSFQPSAKLFTKWFAAGVLLVILFSQGLSTIFPPPEFVRPSPASVVNYGSALDKLMMVISAIVLAPVAEEFLFRGVMYTGFSNAWNKPLAAAFVTGCFILIHPETYSSGYWLTHAFLITVSCVLMLIRELTGAIFPSISFHSGVNLTILFT